MAEKYIYNRLDDPTTHIRLFTLLSSNDRSAPLQGSLKTINQGPQNYEALSYVWGNGAKTSAIKIANTELHISSSLASALLYIRNPTTPRTLWIDAICIDQTDDDEKTHQVGRMFSIFHQAARVLIWLGAADEDSDFAMDHVDKVHRADERGKNRVGTLFQRSWWRRVWTLQEGLAASNASVVMCGSKLADWDVTIRALESLLQPSKTHAWGWEPYVPLELQFFLHVLARFKKGERVTLAELVHESMKREATDPRDHVYALLGLVRDPSFDQFVPDYSKSISWAYQKAMLSIMTSRKDLDFFMYRVGQTTAWDGPSWCVDFAAPSLFWMGPHSNAHMGVSEHGVCSSNTDFDFSAASHDICAGTLAMGGVSIGKIRTLQALPTRIRAQDSPISSSGHNGFEMRPPMQDVLDDILDMIQICKKAWTQRLSAQEARRKIDRGDIWKVALRGRDLEILSSMRPVIAEGYKMVSTLRTHDTQALHKRTTIVSDTEFARAWAVFHRLVQGMVRDRCLFVTDTGYVGSAAQDIQAGDTVCVLFGCTVPLVLRPQTDGTYKLVDAVYVDGVMEEESVDDFASSERTFVLS